MSRQNERIRSISTILGAVGLAVLAATSGRWFLTDFDALLLSRLVGSGLMFWSGWFILTMLEGEDMGDER